MTLKENIGDIYTGEAKASIGGASRAMTEAELLTQAKDDMMMQIMESITRLYSCNVKL